MKIFLYHRINIDSDPLWPSIHPDLFYKQIKFLNKNYKILNLEESLCSESNKNTHNKLASIVFDDGYKDLLQYAVPILNEFNIKPSIYIVTDTIDKGQLIWTYLFDYLFTNTKKKKLSITFGNKPIKYNWKNLNRKLQIARKLKIILKKTDRINRIKIMQSIEDQLDDVKMPNSPYLSWDDLRLLSKQGIVIGSHSANHELLDQIIDDKEINYELNHSAQRIKSELGKLPETISYPNGNYNKKVIEMTKAAGYTYGLAVKQKSFNPVIDNLFEIPRIELFNEPMWKTKLRINGTITQIKSILKR